MVRKKHYVTLLSFTTKILDLCCMKLIFSHIDVSSKGVRIHLAWTLVVVVMVRSLLLDDCPNDVIGPLNSE